MVYNKEEIFFSPNVINKWSKERYEGDENGTRRHEFCG